MDINVTGLVDFDESEGECLPLIRCVCGAEFEQWDFTLRISPDDARECPNCHRRLYFENVITVYEVDED